MKASLPGVILVFVMLTAARVDAHGFVRRDVPGMPVASSVVVPAGAEYMFLGGVLPDFDGAAAGQKPDTAAQARSVLGKIQAELATAGFAMTDIVRMEVYLVPDPDRGGAVDVLGLTSAYLAFFDREDGGLPVRTTVQVAGLPAPGALIQISVTAARHGDHHHDE